MTESPKCQEPGCGLEMKGTFPLLSGIITWACPRTPEEHRLCAKVAAGEARERALEAKLAEADFCIAWQADPSDGTDPHYMGRTANMRGMAAQDAAIEREAERNKVPHA